MLTIVGKSAVTAGGARWVGLKRMTASKHFDAKAVQLSVMNVADRDLLKSIRTSSRCLRQYSRTVTSHKMWRSAAAEVAVLL
ncbi:unnamed protein product [Ectocarpus sp. CCAP 1310/34]|nr:unnamed protein product [Ectocarpus sp. CCAP 1310/34]